MVNISVVIPLYNKKDYIERTLLSVLNQTYDDYEIVIVDDGSTDGSVEIVHKFLGSKKIRLIKKENGGPSSARNCGVKEAKGQWIVFLDADDLLLPYSLQCFSDLIKEAAPVKYIICNYYQKSGDNLYPFSKSRRRGRIRSKFFLEAARDLTERPGSAILKKELLLNHPFKETLRRYEDAECQYNIMRENAVYVSPIPVMITDRDASCAAAARKDIGEDFIGHLDFAGKPFWEQMSLYVLALSSLMSYPEVEKLYSKELKRLDFRVAFYYVRIWSKITNVIRNYLYRDKVESYNSLLNKTEYDN